MSVTPTGPGRIRRAPLSAAELPQLAAIFAPLLSAPFSEVLRIVPLEALTG